MKMKKILLIIAFLFIFSGCKIENISNDNIEENIKIIFSKDIKNLNTNAIGYQYYLPSYKKKKNVNDFNQELYYNGKTFYLYADVVSYYHKVENGYKENQKAYISKKLDYNAKNGYLEINENKGKYYVEMMYNYAKIEGYVKKEDLVDFVSSISYILRSVKYNDNVIETIIGDKRYDLSENETYNIFKTIKTGDANFLDYVNEYDNYNGSEELNSLIDKDEIKTEEKEN